MALDVYTSTKSDPEVMRLLATHETWKAVSRAVGGRLSTFIEVQLVAQQDRDGITMEFSPQNGAVILEVAGVRK